MVEVGDYFVCLDEAPIRFHGRSLSPKYDLLCGDPDAAVGVLVASAGTIKALLARAPAGCPVYRTYLRRTDGKTGKKLIREG